VRALLRAAFDGAATPGVVTILQRDAPRLRAKGVDFVVKTVRQERP
jgi:hypothetical protein